MKPGGLTPGQWELVVDYLPWAHRVAGGCRSEVRRFGWEDVFDQAQWGLIRAARCYRPGGGAGFARYSLLAMVREVRKLWKAGRQPRQVDGWAAAEDETARPDPESGWERQEQLAAALARVTDGEAELLFRVYGVGGPAETTPEVAAALGVTRQTVWKWADEALRKARGGENE